MTQQAIEDWVLGLKVGDTVAVHEAPTDGNRMFETGRHRFNGQVVGAMVGYWKIKVPGISSLLFVGKGTAWGAGGVCIRPVETTPK